MNKKGLFFSLKWKIAVLIGGVFLLLHSIFSYLLYLDVNEDFTEGRQNLTMHYSNIARALTKDSFLVLDQFAELFSILNTDKQNENNELFNLSSVLDRNWQQWQFIWGLESAVFFDQNGALLHHWGNPLSPDPLSVGRVLKKESPEYQIICPDECFQFVMIPVMENSKLVGAFGVSRSFADTVIKYHRATGSDIAVLVSDTKSLHSEWPYKTSVMTHVEPNKEILAAVAKEYQFADFLNKRKVIRHKNQSFEISVFSIKADRFHRASPFFLTIENITEELHSVTDNLKTIWFYGVISLVLSLVLLFVVLFFAFRRVNALSSALPLLANHQYGDFRLILRNKTSLTFGYDELDLLNHTALSLSDQLEGLENEIKESICKLVEQGQDLMTERDFNQQLINVAPILVITQDENGIILSINKAGVEEFSIEESLIIGCVFDNFIPESEIEHLIKLKKLRSGEISEHIKFDGVLLVNQDQQRQISWIHTIVKPKRDQKPPFVLSLGVDVSERKHIEDKMLRMANHDQLTGMSNRRYFQTEFVREIASAKRYETQLALFYLDLDQFKVVNDTSGHDSGDKLLKLVSKTLQQVVRGSDILSRIGGDEFTLIMPNIEMEGVKNVAIKINESLMALDFWVDDKVYKISTSIGIAIYPQHGIEVDELLSNADLAMYQAKETGPGQYHIFSADNDYQSRLSSRLFWKDIIVDALKKDRFVVCYEPILDIKADCITHYECLTRIKTEEGRLLMPDEFISFAEELGLIGQIDRIVLEKVIEQHKKFNEQGKNFKLAVNLSARSFNDKNIFKDIAALVNKPDIKAEQIVFEITETAAISNFSDAQDLIKKIKSIGCAFTLDDFGVGFSSFYYLKYLSVDYVKIDASFIRQLDSNYEDRVFVRALIEVSQALGKKTVAEFVENEAILQVLKELGIDYVQGVHIGKSELIE